MKDSPGYRHRSPVCPRRSVGPWLLPAFLLGLLPAAAGAALPAGLTSPDARVVCSEARGTCYDRYGPSIGLTHVFLGTDAADRMAAALRGQAPPGKTFTPAPGIVCVRETGPCRDGDAVAEELTKILYGALPEMESRR
jgi:hypothetical protein